MHSYVKHISPSDPLMHTSTFITFVFVNNGEPSMGSIYRDRDAVILLVTSFFPRQLSLYYFIHFFFFSLTSDDAGEQAAPPCCNKR